MLTIGFMVMNEFNTKAIPLIKQLVTDKNVISNYKLGLPHTQYVPYDQHKFSPNTRQIKTGSQPFMDILSAIVDDSDELILLFNNETHFKKSISDFSYIEFSKARCDKTHVIIGDQPLSDDLLNQLLHLKKEQQMKNVLATPNGMKLRLYQQYLVDKILEYKRIALFVDMGLGKTLATLATINQLVKSGKISIKKPVLIIAPILVALDTWSREAEKWGYDFDVKVNIQLTPKKRQALFDEMTSKPLEKLTILTTNREQLENVINHFTKFDSHPFDYIIIDELSLFKSPTTLSFRCANQIAKTAKYFTGLTGSPAPNKLLEIWGQMIITDNKNKLLLGRTFDIFRDTYFIPDKVNKTTQQIYSYKIKNKDAEYEIYDKLKQTSVALRSDGLVELPPIVYVNKYVTLPKKAKKTYDEWDQKIRQALKESEEAHVRNANIEVDIGKTQVKIHNRAVLHAKLSQLASGAIYDNLLDMKTNVDNGTDNGKSIEIPSYTVFHDEKFKMLKEIVDTSTSPILVFFSFKSDLDRMHEFIDFTYLDAKSSKARETIVKWNRGEIPVMVAHPNSVGHGLNLQDGGHIMVWLNLPSSNDHYRQGIKRLHRSGQKHTVTIMHILAKGTNDEDRLNTLEEREVSQQQLKKALQDYIQ